MNKLLSVFIIIAIAVPSLAGIHHSELERFIRRIPVPAVFTPEPSNKGWVDCLVCTTANRYVDFLWAGMGSMPRVAGNFIKVTNGSVVVDVEIGQVLTSGQQIFVTGNVGSVSFGATVGGIDKSKLAIKISGSTFHPITNVYSKRQIEDLIVDARRRLSYQIREKVTTNSGGRRTPSGYSISSGYRKYGLLAYGGFTGGGSGCAVRCVLLD